MNNSTSCVSINVQDILFNLAKQKDERIFYFLEKDKTLINIQDGNGNSLLHWAVFLNNVYLVYYLLENNAERDIKSHSKQTPLFWAICSNNILMIYILNKYGSNLFQEDDKGYNCLIISIQYNNILAFFYLLYLNISITHKDYNNCTVVDWAAYNNNLFFLRFFSIFMNNLYSLNLNTPTSTLHKAIIGNSYEACVYLIMNNHQNVYDIGTDDNKTILQFVEDNKSKIDPRIYQFLNSKQVLYRICQKKGNRNRDRNRNFLYEENGTIGPYTIKKKKKLPIFLSIYTKYIENKAILLYPLMLLFLYVYLNITYFLYVRKYIDGQQLYLDLFHPFLFVIYYFVVTSNPGYLVNNKNNVPNINLEGKKKKDMNMKCRNGDNDKDTYYDVDTKDEGYKDKPLNDYDKKANNKERPKENITFQYIIKNITDEINRYERKYKLVEFAKRIKKENIFELKNSMEINWDIPLIEFTEINMNMLCPTCFLFKNLRTKHCSLCDKCVEIFDHHCDFTLNCMGIENARIFLLWILLNIFFSFSIIYIYGWFIFNSSLNYYNIKFYIILMAIVLSILIIYFMGAIFIRSIMNILENITSNEKFKIYTNKTFFTYELTMDEKKQPTVIRKFKNPFDQGMFFNLINFLTKSKTKLIKKEKQFIIIDKNIKSQKLTEFVDKLNKRLSEMNIE
ncbi:palmitoyltransferase, putative [Plasmodium reichenowi]|uniref:Palmitoyltransferase n=1 Tax=Plasmodium reichenowi TaxID=5854 RepID=A0A060S2D9_PLARE|nr:palmitoyltransferase, putative [Plasmodium reichenowi]